MDAFNPNLQKFMSCRWCHVIIISSAIRPLVLLTIMPCNEFFFMDNQIYLLLSHLSSTIKPPINYFSLGTRATSFCWKLCPLWSSGCVDLFFALLLLASMPQNDSVFICATNLKAASHQNNICLRLITDPNKVTIRLIAKLTSQLLFKIHFYQAFCLIAYCWILKLLSCNKLHPCWLLVAFLKM